MEFPVYEHGVSVGYGGLQVFVAESVEAEKGARNAHEVDEIGEGGEDGCLFFKVSTFVFGECTWTRYDSVIFTLFAWKLDIGFDGI